MISAELKNSETEIFRQFYFILFFSRIKDSFYIKYELSAFNKI